MGFFTDYIIWLQNIEHYKYATYLIPTNGYNTFKWCKMTVSGYML